MFRVPVVWSTRRSVFVRGDSMEPTLHDGDVCMIDLGRTTIKNGKFYAIRVGEYIHVKRLAVMADGRIRVKSDNAESYPPEIFPPDYVHVIGKIVWDGREVA